MWQVNGINNSEPFYVKEIELTALCHCWKWYIQRFSSFLQNSSVITLSCGCDVFIFLSFGRCLLSWLSFTFLRMIALNLIETIDYSFLTFHACLHNSQLVNWVHLINNWTLVCIDWTQYLNTVLPEPCPAARQTKSCDPQSQLRNLSLCTVLVSGLQITASAVESEGCSRV